MRIGPWTKVLLNIPLRLKSLYWLYSISVELKSQAMWNGDGLSVQSQTHTTFCHSWDQIRDSAVHLTSNKDRRSVFGSQCNTLAMTSRTFDMERLDRDNVCVCVCVCVSRVTAAGWEPGSEQNSRHLALLSPLTHTHHTHSDLLRSKSALLTLPQHTHPNNIHTHLQMFSSHTESSL